MNAKQPTAGTDKVISRKQFAIVILLLFFLISIWIATPIALNYFYSDLTKQAQFGDQFGSINSLFTVLSLTGVIATLLIQSKELKNQIHENRKQAEALVAQQNALIAGNQYEAISKIYAKYETAEMMEAIRSMWKLYKECDGAEDLKSKYNTLMNKSNEKIDEILPEKAGEYRKASIHYKRRLVDSFYSLANSSIEHKMIPAKVFYDRWSGNDLEIIRSILFPINQMLHELTDSKKLEWQDYPLSHLYDNHPDVFSTIAD